MTALRSPSCRGAPLRGSLAFALATVLAAGVTCGPRAPGPARPRAGAAEAGAPRVRVGGILRLARAGVIEEVTQADGRRAVVALVPAARHATGWQRAFDTQGNAFRVAPGGRLVPDGEPRPEREPASVENVAYYFAQSLALMAVRFRRQGLAMAMEVLDLPGEDAVVRAAQQHLCRLFHRLGIQGAVRERLYRNLVAVSHRRGAAVEVRNHVHQFAVTMPLGWKLLAGSLPKLGPRATVLVLALPGAAGDGDGALANLLWTTTGAPATGTLTEWAAARRLATAGSRVHPLRLAAPPGARGAVAFRVEPVVYQGRRLRSWQLFFQERGRFHHLTLLAAPGTDPAGLRPALEVLLATFRPGPWPSPCGRSAPPAPGPRAAAPR